MMSLLPLIQLCCALGMLTFPMVSLYFDDDSAATLCIAVLPLRPNSTHHITLLCQRLLVTAGRSLDRIVRVRAFVTLMRISELDRHFVLWSWSSRTLE